MRFTFLNAFAHFGRTLRYLQSLEDDAEAAERSPSAVRPSENEPFYLRSSFFAFCTSLQSSRIWCGPSQPAARPGGGLREKQPERQSALSFSARLIVKSERDSEV